MHLLFATNDAYVPHVATTLCSIFENNKDMQFVVHVMATDISDDNRRKLQLFVESYHQTLDIKLINPDELEIDLSVCGKWGIFPSLKLYAADLYPNVDRMLYVDADMICLGSLKEIDNLDMTNWYVAACPDEEGSSKHKKRLGMPIDSFYGCAVLSETAVFQYKCDEFYHPEADGGISILDTSLGIDWKIPTDKAILSEKDTKHSLLKELNSPFDINVDLY